jgi:hypothetical protein
MSLLIPGGNRITVLPIAHYDPHVPVDHNDVILDRPQHFPEQVKLEIFFLFVFYFIAWNTDPSLG